MILNRSFALLPVLLILFTVILAGCRSSEELAQTESDVIEQIPANADMGEAETAERPEAEELQTMLTPLPTAPENIPSPMEEFRGVWVATVANIDWPSRPGLPVQQQKEEMIGLLDRAAAMHFNAVIFQVRPAADAFYDSPYEPWSYYLNGKMGEPSDYDPLEFAIEEAHKRGLALHAWFNPFRATHAAGNGGISSDHISRTHPDFVVRYGNHLWLDPGNELAREHTLNVILDVVERYDIDGVHFDDYFYPYPAYANGADFPDEKSWQIARSNGNKLSRADWRRENVNRLIHELSVRIKEIKPDVKFGISPFGIWRPGYPENTTGFDAYTNLYADARLWLKEGWLDYFIPQLYYRIEQTQQPFPVMLEWWAEQNDHQRHLWPGLFTSSLRSAENPWPNEEITGQIYIARAFPEVTGAVHFSMKIFLENSKGFNRSVTSGPYAYPSLLPATPWLGNSLPAAPGIAFRDYGDSYTIRVNHDTEEIIRWWIIQKRYGNHWYYDVVPATDSVLRYHGGYAMIRPDEVQITAVDRTGLKSEPAAFTANVKAENKSSILAEDIIQRSQWAEKPAAGRELNAIRMNISADDTLRFMDMAVILKGMIRSAMFPDHLLKDPHSGSRQRHESAEIVRLQLMKNSVSEEIQVVKGEALNWYGYHITVLDTDFSNGTIQLEIAPATLLSVDRAALQSAQGSHRRFRILHRIEKVMLHHSVLTEDPANTVQSLNAFLDHSLTEENWWDVPYHYLISSDGTIYEGRSNKYAGDTNALYDPRGKLQIGLMRTEESRNPTKEQLESAASLASGLILKHDLGIHGFSSYTEDTGVALSVRAHRRYHHRTIVRIIEERLGL